MPLQIEIKGRLAKPVVVCDHCGQRIAEARQGNSPWPVDGQGHPIESQIYFTHKRCARAWERSRGGTWPWATLCLLPIYLGANLGLDFDKARPGAADLAVA